MSHYEDELARIIDELIQRLRRGERIDWPACFKRFPRYATDLRRWRPVMEGLVKVLVDKGASL